MTVYFTLIRIAHDSKEPWLKELEVILLSRSAKERHTLIHGILFGLSETLDGKERPCDHHRMYLKCPKSLLKLSNELALRLNGPLMKVNVDAAIFKDTSSVGIGVMI